MDGTNDLIMEINATSPTPVNDIATMGFATGFTVDVLDGTAQEVFLGGYWALVEGSDPM